MPPGAPKTFSDTMSGARDDRKGLCELMAYVHEGDTVAVWKLDQLGRNTLHILETVKALTDRGVTLVFTSDGIDSCTPAGRMMIGVLGSLAEYERELTNERTALKRQASRAGGTRFGRPRKVHDPNHIATARRMRQDGHAAKDIAKWEAQRKVIADLVEAQQKAFADFLEQQRSVKIADQWEAQRKAISDQVEHQRKAIRDLVERQWNTQKKAIEDAQNAIVGMFRPKPPE
jgi:hypothetical protein